MKDNLVTFPGICDEMEELRMGSTEIARDYIVKNTVTDMLLILLLALIMLQCLLCVKRHPR